jgi:DNA-binding NtrC family response regulator
MSQDAIQILFAGELPTWLNLTQALLDSPGNSIQLHRATSLRDAMRSLAGQDWDALLLDLYHPPAKELLSALKLHSIFHNVPAIAMFSLSDPDLERAALSSGATTCIPIENLTAKRLQDVTLAVIKNEKVRHSLREATQMRLSPSGPGKEFMVATRMRAISHALSNLLCIISANADILADQLADSQPARHSLERIKRATKTAAQLMRDL